MLYGHDLKKRGLALISSPHGRRSNLSVWSGYPCRDGISHRPARASWFPSFARGRYENRGSAQVDSPVFSQLLEISYAHFSVFPLWPHAHRLYISASKAPRGVDAVKRLDPTLVPDLGAGRAFPGSDIGGGLRPGARCGNRCRAATSSPVFFVLSLRSASRPLPKIPRAAPRPRRPCR